MSDLIIDFVQKRIARGAGREPARSAAAADARASALPLEEQLARLTMACTAMWTLLRTRLGVTDAELVEAIQEVDLRDGVLDGQYKPAALACPACGRRNNRSRRTCMYCESPLPQPAGG